MAATLNPAASAGISIGYSLGSVAEWLRSVSVRVHGPRGRRGSGVVWREDGLIVTNAHVVAKENRCDLHLNDGCRMRGRVIARDEAVDLALLAVDENSLTACRMRSAREMRAGELVLAIGSPWDGESALTAGVFHGAPAGSPFLIADIRLAPGNSGGPLADAYGNVVGVNCAVAGGLGYAVTSDTVARFLRTAGVPEVP